jgi:hypothetical protein
VPLQVVETDAACWKAWLRMNDEIRPRYSVAVDADFIFNFDEPGFAPSADVIFSRERATVTFTFEGREITWHELGPAFYPSVAIAIDDDEDYDEAIGVVLRFLSALAYHTQMPVDVVDLQGGAPSRRDELRTLRARRLGALHANPTRIRLPPDDRARKAIGFWREGRSERNPFYGFLAYWKVLELVIGDDPRKIVAWIDARSGGRQGLGDELNDRCRDAVSHGARSRRSKTVADPDDPRDRTRMDQARYEVMRLAMRAIDETWPHPW